MRHCFAQCWGQSRVNRVDVYPLWLQFWLRASMLQQIGVTYGCECTYGCKWKVWKLPPPVLWRFRWLKRLLLVLQWLDAHRKWSFGTAWVASLWGCCSLCYRWGISTASRYCICLLSMLQLAVPRLRFLSIVSHFHTVMDTLLTKSKTRRPIIVHWGCKLNESYYDPRIRVFVILLSLSVKCLDPSFAVDGTKYLLTLLELQKVIIPTYCVQEQYQQKMV